jgi:hypothetical protein
MSNIDIEFNDDENIIIVVLQETATIDEFKDLIDTTILPWVWSCHPQRVDLIGDMSRIAWDFPAFLKFVTDTIERRKQGGVPETMHQHLVGTDQWINNWRTMMQKRFGMETSAFTSINAALSFVREQR